VIFFKTMSATGSNLGLTLACLAVLCTVSPIAVHAAAKPCFRVTEPVIKLGFGSRYTLDSKTRSDIDEESNQAVNDALKPIDDFIQDLSREAIASASGDTQGVAKAQCVVEAVFAWASADALSDMESMNAKLAVPSRIGGIAVAYGQVRGLAQKSGNKFAVIERWLSRRVNETRIFFDTKAPKKASRNNLRAWASFAVGEVGILTEDAALVTWAQNSNKAMIAQSSDDGSLPLEMARGKYALHYQIHAVAPLVTSMARLCDTGHGTAGADLARLGKIARFTVAATTNPQMVENLAKIKQVLSKDPKKLSGTLAWLEPYEALTADEGLIAKTTVVRPLLNSKLGGDLTRLYGDRSIKCAR
jgi:poly(beta-D-mannuronate) lyase